ncbi:hypothetical protein QTI66_37315 [Variovorax sp. J22R133]|uniref:hypothetical protein n=1 Tax=Variovorax brevis TaxID=3053503 RepID=UPI002575603D|nr:hypothetical protein [Variovorax sp. J22R133]MDM0117761.1 hypothetical protein [Variovorax sp. J22R133]
MADQVEPRKKIARHLGVSLRTLQRYIAAGHAPRPVQLALWFESRWGMSALHEQAFNEARHARAWVASLERECERLREVVRAYENAEAQPAANKAVFTSISPVDLQALLASKVGFALHFYSKAAQRLRSIAGL